MTTKDVMAALERLSHPMDMISQAIDQADMDGIGEEWDQILADWISQHAATLRAFVEQMGPVREVLEHDLFCRLDNIYDMAAEEYAYSVEIIDNEGGNLARFRAPTYTAACTAALEAVDGAGAGEEE